MIECRSMVFYFSRIVGLGGLLLNRGIVVAEELFTGQSLRSRFLLLINIHHSNQARGMPVYARTSIVSSPTPPRSKFWRRLARRSY